MNSRRPRTTSTDPVRRTDAPPPESAAANACLWTGLVLGLAPPLARAMSNLDVLPGWDADPLSSPLLRSGLTPAASMLCDATSLVGSALLFVFVVLAGLRVRTTVVALAAIGTVGALAHALLFRAGGPLHGSIGDARIGLAWVSAIWLGAALTHAGADGRARRVTLAAILGAFAVLALRGAHEFFIDHPRTLDDFHANQDRILASHGWSPGSSMALAFERRVSQSDVSGWFGLSNIYAALCAAAATLFIGLFTGLILGFGPSPERSSTRERTRGLAWLAAGALASLAGVAMAQSKGGVAALLVGLGSLVVFDRLRAHRETIGARLTQKIGGLIGVSAIVGALVLIFVRGAIGERIGELSILFRWFYAQASARIFAAHPLFGAGPDGFQAAYALAKNPISPEDVSSPHSILMDWGATLGLFGLAWGALLFILAWEAGRNAVSPLPDPHPAEPFSSHHPHARHETRAALAIVGLATLAAASTQGLIVTIDFALLRVLAFAAWAALTWGVLGVLRRGVRTRPAVAAAAMALLAHGQIDVDLSWVQSCALGLALIALAACEQPGTHERALLSPRSPARRHALLGIAALPLLIAAASTTIIARAADWEHALFEAATLVEPLAGFNDRLREIDSARPGAPSASAAPEQLRSDLARALGKPIGPTPADLRLALIELDAALTPRAAERLAQAAAIEPRDPRPLRESARLWVRHSDACRLLGRLPEAGASLDRAISALSAPLASGVPPRAIAGSLEANLAQVRLRRAQSSGEPAELRLAAEALERALARDPYNLDLARNRLNVAELQNDPAAIRFWARKCLDLDTLMRLDRAVRGLSGDEKARFQRLAEPSEPSKTP